MKTAVQCLLNVLKEEVSHCESVLELLKAKRKTLIKNDVAGLKKILDEEQGLMSRSKELEDMRLSIVGAMGQKLGLPHAKLVEIVDHVESDVGAKLKGIRQTLAKLIERIHYENWVINKLINKSLEWVNFNMRLLAGVRGEDKEKMCYSMGSSGKKSTHTVFLDQKG